MAEFRVTVRAPARLHLGFLDPGGRAGRRFGGIGLALEAPETRITLSRANRDEAHGPDGDRALAHCAALRAALGIPGFHALHVGEAIPAHAGLGSGTQLALATAAALRRLEGLAPDTRRDAAITGRGARSGLGAAFMETGGVAVDGGKASDDDPAPPPIVANLAFPAEWRVILVGDPTGEGVHGQAELDAFAALPPFPEQGVASLCRLVLTGALPALAERDLAAFGAAIATIQQMVGAHFAPAQGGVFASQRVARALASLRAAGAHGIGQSSWGPTGFCFAPSAAEASRLVAALGADPTPHAVTARIVRARAGGADIRSLPSTETAWAKAPCVP